MSKRVAGKGSVIYFYVQFEIVHQIVLSHKTDTRSRIIIVLMFCWFAGLWLYKESSFKTIFSCIIFCGVQKFCKMFLLSFHVGIQQGHVALTASPKNIIFAAQFDSRIQRSFYLRSGMRQYLEIRIGGSTIHISSMRKK